MTQPSAPEFSRPVPAERIGAAWFGFEAAASETELAAVAARLGIVGVASLSCRFRLRRDAASDGALIAEGELSAEVAQICVVTLEPFETALAERFSVRFVPAADISDDLDLEADDEIPYEGGVVDLGEAAVEQLALLLDPFPRRPDAVLPDVSEEGPDHPFAALAGRTKMG